MFTRIKQSGYKNVTEAHENVTGGHQNETGDHENFNLKLNFSNINFSLSF